MTGCATGWSGDLFFVFLVLSVAGTRGMREGELAHNLIIVFEDIPHSLTVGHIEVAFLDLHDFQHPLMASLLLLLLLAHFLKGQLQVGQPLGHSPGPVCGAEDVEPCVGADPQPDAWQLFSVHKLMLYMLTA